MRERPPNLLDEAVSAGVREGYGLAVAGIEFLPLGNDAGAWVYRVSAANGSAYFAKVKRGLVYAPSLTVPRYLKDLRLAQVVAPLPARTRELWQRLGDFALIVYPFIEGRSGRAEGLTDRQWRELGTVLKAMHAPAVAAGLAGQIERETFAPKYSAVVAEVQARVDGSEWEGAAEQELAARWRRKQAEIRQLVQRAEALGARLAGQRLEFGVCHTDIHTDNVMVDREGGLWIVDWDAPLLAPKERDLMFMVGPASDAASRATPFFQGYGSTKINPVALAYYRYEWVVQEIGDYGKRVYLTPGLGEASKAEALREFERLFELGNVVTAAYAAERAVG